MVGGPYSSWGSAGGPYSSYGISGLISSRKIGMGNGKASGAGGAGTNGGTISSSGQ